ncbi:MAG: mechanosensitive ion channel [Acidobacteriota bacterium]|nr:MAG: mechanosensitive ion channel [Acidobacteriota bacterium]
MSNKGWKLILGALVFSVGVGIVITHFLGKIRRPASFEALRAGFIEEFITRNDGYPGLREHYGLRFPSDPEEFDPYMIYQQVAEQRVDVISGHSTAGSMQGYDLAILEDDRNFFLPYEAAPLVRRQTLDEHPELKDILGKLAGQISEEQIREMNYQVEYRGKDAAEVAWDFLVSRKLIDPGNEPGDGSAGTITIGAKFFAEHDILTRLMAVLIEHHSNVKVLRKLKLIGTATCFDALRRGQIDLYVEYTGTGLILLEPLLSQIIQEPGEAFETVRHKFADEYDLVWLDRFGFNNTWTLVMRSEQARQLGIKTISDLANVLKEQSETLARRTHGVGISPPRTAAPSPPREAPLTAAEHLRSLERRQQPPTEFGRRSVTQEEYFRAKHDLADSEMELDSVRERLRAELPKALKAAQESKEKALTARVEAEKHRVSVFEQERKLKEHRLSMAETAATTTSIKEVYAAYRRVAMTEDLYRYVQALVDSLEDARHEYVRHQELLKELMAEPGKTEVAAEDLKTLRDELEQAPREITILAQHADTAARRLEQVKNQVSLARERLEISKEHLKLEPKPDVSARPDSTRSLPAGATLDELKRETERRKAEAQSAENKADLAEEEADQARELTVTELKEMTDFEWELRYARDVLKRLQREGVSPDTTAAAQERIDFLEGTLARIQTTLSQLEQSMKENRQRAREKRLHAESMHRAAEDAAARLREEETELFNEKIRKRGLAGFFAALTIGLAVWVHRLVRDKERLSLRGVTDPEKTKRIHTPYVLIRRIAVPLIGIVGTLLVLLQFETFQRISLSILASAGIAGVVVGLAARSLLANAVAGVTLAFSQPIRIGDTVKMGDEWGTIEDIGLFHTIFLVWDHRRMVIPNEVLAGREIVNYSLRDQKIWTKVPIYLDYDADVKKAREILIEVAKESKNWNGKDEPEVWFMELGEQTICLWIAAWADDPDKAWRLGCDILDNALRRFQEEGIPLPRRRFQLDGPQIAFEPEKGPRAKEE